MERWRLKSHQERIEIFCGSADIIVLTHFRADLVESPGNKAYRNKIFLLKNPNCLADRVQRKRAFEFIRSVREHAQEIQYIDGRKINRNDTSVIFSDPFPFDQRDKKGSYVQVSVNEGDHCFHFSSKVRGPWQDEAAEYIIQQNPDSIYLDGPGSGEEGSEDDVSMDDAVIRIKWIMEKTRLVDMILDHHLMRDTGWQEGIEPLYRLASKMGIRIQTAAEVRGEPVQALEARRKYLYETDPHPGEMT